MSVGLGAVVRHGAPSSMQRVQHAVEHAERAARRGACSGSEAYGEQHGMGHWLDGGEVACHMWQTADARPLHRTQHGQLLESGG